MQAVPGLAEEKPQQLNVFQRTAGSLHTDENWTYRVSQEKFQLEFRSLLDWSALGQIIFSHQARVNIEKNNDLTCRWLVKQANEIYR